MLQRLRRSTRLLLAITVAAIAALSACGGSDATQEFDSSVTTEDLFAPGDDATDLTVKPPVDDDFLGSVDELITTDLVVGDGDEATSGSQVSVQYVGVLASDGSQFDASWDRGATPLPFTLGIGQVISGWDQGVEGMRVGGRRVLQIPAAQAYGEQSPSASIPANSDLVFIVDLLEVAPPPPPTPTPEPAPPVPEDALGEFDELIITDLAEGSGPEIVSGDIITVNYVGVRGEDGEEFDSSWGRGQPFTFIAGRGSVIEGWQQGMLGAQVGTERLLQIPSEQAYGQGDLVFRVHVVDVVEAPLAHTLTYSGSPPDDVVVETLIDGSGDGAEAGDVVNAGMVVLRHSDSAILQSTYESGTLAPLFVSDEGLLPGLNDGVIGIATGETRQIIVPVEIAFPDGVPANAGAEPGDALVFIVEAVEIAPLEGE